jgi:nitrate/TMAO reductase-like tetraheme cytochrome c subunit
MGLLKSLLEKMFKDIKENDESEEMIENEGKMKKLLKFIGIHIPKDKEDRIHIRTRFFKFIGVLIGFFILLLIGLFEYSTSPRFCKSCHIMKPYYDAWKSSKHNSVPCVKCHYPPGTRNELWIKFQATAQVVKYVTRTYSSKPYAEIEDASCLRKGCHSTRLLEGKVKFKRGIIFDHRPHLLYPRRGKKLRCTSCHSQIVIGTHVEVTESTCFICHFKGAKHGREENPLGGCLSCHEAPKQDIEYGGIIFNHKDFTKARGVPCQKCHIDVIQGKGEAPKERCYACHNDPKILKMYGDTTFMHDTHVTKHKVECTHCHLEIKHSVKPVKLLEVDCGICHEKKHGGQKEMYMGIGGKGVEPMPNPMFLAQVDCIGCHVMPKTMGAKRFFTGETYEASEISCIGCHGMDYRGMLKEWKESINESLNEVKPFLDKSLRLINSVPKIHKNYRKAFKLYKDARFNYEFVKYAKGVHNVEYADALLNKAKEYAEKSISLLSGNYKIN